jgi:hypothetical protein
VALLVAPNLRVWNVEGVYIVWLVVGGVGGGVRDMLAVVIVAQSVEFRVKIISVSIV